MLDRAAHEQLCARQAEIAKLVADGRSNREIADLLVLSTRTVENHIAAIFNKLGVGSRSELASALLRACSERATGLAPVPQRTNLPPERTALIGREAEITEIAGLIEARRVVTITGTGGVGKTRVALAVGRRMLESTPGGAWLVELAATSAAFATAAVAQIFGLQESAGRPLLAALVAQLERRDALLILDNCEHLVGEVAVLADALLRGCARLRILATSREPLRIAGEQLYRLPSLGVPAPSAAARDSAIPQAEYPAIALFVARAQAVDRNFTLTDANATAVADICRRLDGIPLAIELAAARVNFLSVAALLTKLDGRLRLLVTGDRTALPRQRTMHALIDWSYDLLTAAEQRLFERLAIFAGGCELPEIVVVYGDDDETVVLESLGSLVDKSLLVVDLERAEPRYRLLETSRQYALERLIARGDFALVARRHALAYLDVADRLDRDSEIAQDARWYARVEAEIENCRTALAWALGPTGDRLLAQHLAGAMVHVWRNHSVVEGLAAIRTVRGLVDDATPSSIRALIDSTAVRLHLQRGEWDRALAESRRLTATYEELGDLSRMARMKHGAGYALVCLGRAAEAEPFLAEAAATARANALHTLAASALTDLCYAHSLLGRLDAARADAAEALAIHASINAHRGTATTLVVLAEAEFLAGNVDRALDLARASLAAMRAAGAAHFGAAERLNLAAYSIAVDRWDDARAASREVLGHAHDTSRNTWLAWAIQHLGAIAALTADAGDDPSARREIAARLLGYVDAQIVNLHALREYTEQQEYDRVMRALGAALERERLTILMAEGAALSQDVAVELAMSI